MKLTGNVTVIKLVADVTVTVACYLHRLAEAGVRFEQEQFENQQTACYVDMEAETQHLLQLNTCTRLARSSGQEASSPPTGTSFCLKFCETLL